MEVGLRQHTNIHAMRSQAQQLLLAKKLGRFYLLVSGINIVSACAHSKKVGNENSNHTCFKNWSGLSSSMETNDGFQKAESQHIVRYLRFIGDGDSSVHPVLVAKVPVWGYTIRKIECANHATK